MAFRLARRWPPEQEEEMPPLFVLSRFSIVMVPAHCGEHVSPELGLMSSPFAFSLFHYELLLFGFTEVGS